MGKRTDPLDEHEWTRLAEALRDLVAAHVPEWSERPAHDPGVTLVQVFAFLGEGLLKRAAAIPERERAAIDDVVARLASRVYQDASHRLTVRVDGARWREVASFASAGPEDAVYVVDGDGVVTFGDGRHGRRPPSGARVSVAFREGTGDPGNVRVAVDCLWPPPARGYVVSLAPDRGIAIRVSAAGAERYSGVKRVHYFDGKLLGIDDLRDEQEYYIGKRRLHNRALHGPGVVEGLAVRLQADTTPPTVLVEPGFALDPQGREIVLAEPLAIAMDDGTSPRLVAIECAERLTNPVPGPDAETAAYARVEEGAAIRLVGDDGCAEGIALARLVFDSVGWGVDPTFEPTRLACCKA